MITRLTRYALAYPLWFYAAAGLGWSYGLTAVYQAAHRSGRAPTASGLAVTAATIAVTLLLFRAVDDVRDLDYDRVQNPRRPLVTGAVRVRDLLLLFFLGMVVLLLFNAPRGIPAAGYGAVCGYVCLIVFLDWRWKWPSADRLLLQLLVNIPLQTLICGYVYLGATRGYDTLPSGPDVAAALGFVLSLTHLEFARRLVRAPEPHTRTYVHALGVDGTVRATLACAFAAAGLELVATRPWSPGQAAGWLVLIALPVPVIAAVRFHQGAPRWSTGLAVLYLLLSFSSFAAIGLLNTL
ncbi:hypothetical protein [Streptomyces sp. NPDC002088]|uniref:hypothetical protein n=1 Tax=Streptomyces sp. NPDC002088 TaxID=3154665 RepID=UPI003322962D